MLKEASCFGCEGSKNTKKMRTSPFRLVALETCRFCHIRSRRPSGKRKLKSTLGKHNAPPKKKRHSPEWMPKKKEQSSPLPFAFGTHVLKPIRKLFDDNGNRCNVAFLFDFVNKSFVHLSGAVCFGLNVTPSHRSKPISLPKKKSMARYSVLVDFHFTRLGHLQCPHVRLVLS